MAVPLEKFVQQLEDSGIVAGETLMDFLPPKASPKSAEELALELVRNKKLTKFQAEEVSRGKGKSLTLGNYVLMEKIGAGGMGQVFKAEHRRMHRIVAIKVLPSNLTKDVAAIARFEREVTAAAKINHPNIVTAYDADQADGVHFLVMELVEGSDLSALVKKNGPFPVETAVNYILQAAKGLEAAHAEGIVHRDIKPANLLLDKKGTVKILDMGLARIHGEAGQAELTSTGAVMGTVDYMAPEQALNTKTADARADIYALGCSLYYLLAGKATYDGDTLMAKLLAHRDQPIPSLRSVRSEMPEQLEVVFRKMVAKNIDDRFQTMAEVIAALEGCGSGPTNRLQDKSFTSRTVNTSSSRQLPESLANASHTEFVDDIPAAPKSPRSKTLTNGPSVKLSSAFLIDQKKLLMIGSAFIGVTVLLAIVIVTLQGSDTKLIVTVNEPDAIVEVLNQEGHVEVTRKGDMTPIKISIEPGTHRIMVQKDGFELFTDSFEIKSGKKVSITAKLVPVTSEAVGSKAVERAKRAAESLLNKGAKLWTEVADKATEILNETQLPDDIHNVTRADFTHINLAEDDYSHLVALPGLRKLYFFECPIGDSGVEHIANLTGLARLMLNGCQVTDKGVGFLRRLSNLEYLDLNHQPITDEGLAVLAQMPKLQALHLVGSLVTDNGLAHIRSLPLRRLALDGTGITDAGVAEIAKCQELEVLDLSGTHISDASVARIKALSKLTQLYIGRTEITSAGVAALKEAFPRTSIFADDPAKTTKPITNINDPAFKQWIKVVQALPAEQQLEAVSKKLMELNPGFDGKLTDTSWAGTRFLQIENGVVVGISFSTDNVTDISPVRALSGLKLLDVSGKKLVDLSPLKGMKLTLLACIGTQVSDLSPLQGMPLTTLVCYGSRISNLSPLKQLNLTYLHIAFTQVSDLSPLLGMHLTGLITYGTPVSDLSLIRDNPLKQIGLDFKPARDTELLRSIKTLETINDKSVADFWKEVEEQQKGKKLAFQLPGFDQWVKEVQAMPAEKQVEAVSKKLMELNPGFDGKLAQSAPPKIENGVVVRVECWTDHVTDISPLRALTGMRELHVDGLFPGRGALTDLSPLKGLALKRLSFANNPKLSDLAPIKGLPLTGLVCCHSEVSDLSPLQGMNLTSLAAFNTPVSDLSPLRGMKLGGLQIWHTNVSDLSPLTGMPLEVLMVQSTKVSNLSPLKGSLLKYLNANNTNITQVSPLLGMPLDRLVLDFNIIQDAELLRSIKTLDVINDKPAAEFWKEFDEQQKGKKLGFQLPGFDQWMKQVQAMPAERQVEAVSKKLMDLNPGFDGKVKHIIESGVVRQVDFVVDEVTDLSPVRAFVGIKGLVAVPSVGGKTKLSNLSPLQGISLSALIIYSTEVADLSPLEQMPLNHLQLELTHVSDLSPLKGMPLTHLAIDGLKVSDLSPLKGMQLVSLTLDGTLVSDLSLLEGMPLTYLKIGGYIGTSIADLSPLHGMSLTFLWCANTKVTDFTLLKDMPLKEIGLDFKPERDTVLLRSIKTLETINDKPVAEFWKEVEEQKKGKKLGFQMTGFDPWVKEVQAMPAKQQVEAVSKKLVELNPGFDGTVTGWQGRTPEIDNGVVTQVKFVTDNVTDISPVRAFKRLNQLWCDGTGSGTGRLADLSPLQGMSLVRLQFNKTEVADLSPLKGMPLTVLQFYFTKVADLSPIKEMSLSDLHLGHTTVSDLSPLKGMPLLDLSINACPISNLSQLEGMKLRFLDCSETPVTDLSPLKGMPLTGLQVYKTNVSNLLPLQEMPIEQLWAANTQVSDLSPLKGMKLSFLSIGGTLISDLSPLEGMDLTEAWLTPQSIKKGIDLLRKMKSLKTINVDGQISLSSADFWKKYDAGEFGTPQPATPDNK